jgi:3-oxo-4,17-pregnadiene-20-carboxyl-CoA hydratase alpha subunit
MSRWFPDEMPLPAATAETQPWWEAAREHRLVAQRCVACGTLRHPPGPICPSCSSTTDDWAELSGRGSVYTYTVVHQQFVPADVPYVVIAVDLVEGLRMVSNLVDADPAEARIGLAVELVWEDMGPELALPRFRPARG